MRQPSIFNGDIGLSESRAIDLALHKAEVLSEAYHLLKTLLMSECALCWYYRPCCRACPLYEHDVGCNDLGSLFQRMVDDLDDFQFVLRCIKDSLIKKRVELEYQRRTSKDSEIREGIDEYA